MNRSIIHLRWFLTCLAVASQLSCASAVVGGGEIDFGIAPSSVQVASGGAIQFRAGAGTTWSVVEGAAGGTVTSTGLYTAPQTAGTFHVEARSVADPIVVS